MTCCGPPTPTATPGFARHFDKKRVAQELQAYQTEGPVPTTRALIHALLGAGVKDATLLDIGGGVGAIQYALLEAGARSATSVEASADYLDVAREEALRHKLRDRIRYEAGDFVDVAARVALADIVTLDRVVCCYADMEKLVRLSAERSRRLYGLVYPRDRALIRAGVRVENFFRWLFRNRFRSYVHAVDAMDALIRSLGFGLRQRLRTFKWEVVVYEKPMINNQ
jgi:magnesium-protoporphyrin O-methyltransferase